MKKDIINIGVNDKKIDLFEGQYKVPNGMAYNSYVILDEKIAVLDTVDARFFNEWIENLNKTIGERAPNYLIVHHMEPDHSANILMFSKLYPNAVIVSNSKAFKMMKNYFGTEFCENRIIVNDGDTLKLGKYSLSFYTAAMVHWPEVMMSYESVSKTLFSADAFGKFGATDTEDEWVCEARRYYFGIVGKYGAQVQMILNKLSSLDINTICPLHGPILDKNLEHYVKLYSLWSSYTPEVDGVSIFYTSVYGNTKKAIEILVNEFYREVPVFDLARCDVSEAVEYAFKYSKIVLATTTYNGHIFPFMRNFIDELLERNYQNRLIGIIDNGSWAPTVEKTIKKLFESSKNVSFTNQTVTINSSVSEENINELKLLANELKRSR